MRRSRSERSCRLTAATETPSRRAISRALTPSSFAVARSCLLIVPSASAISSASSSLIGAASPPPRSSISSLSGCSGLGVEVFDIALTIVLGWKKFALEKTANAVSISFVQALFLDLVGQTYIAADERVPFRKKSESARVPGAELDHAEVRRSHAPENRGRALAVRPYEVWLGIAPHKGIRQRAERVARAWTASKVALSRGGRGKCVEPRRPSGRDPENPAWRRMIRKRPLLDPRYLYQTGECKHISQQALKGAARAAAVSGWQSPIRPKRTTTWNTGNG